MRPERAPRSPRQELATRSADFPSVEQLVLVQHIPLSVEMYFAATACIIEPCPVLTQTFSGLPGHAQDKPTPGSVAEAFSQAMNHAFQRTVGASMAHLVKCSRSATRFITGEELQSAWTTRKGEVASACDWAICAGRIRLVVEATNHHLDARLAQGSEPRRSLRRIWRRHSPRPARPIPTKILRSQRVLLAALDEKILQRG